MAPKPTPKATGKGAKQSGGDAPKATRSQVEFGLPPAVVTSLQAITSRATQGLWHSDQTGIGEVTAEQHAQRRANLIRTLSKRITGNVKAKAELKDALNQWLVQLSQHLQGLTARVSAIGQKIDEDLQSACDEMVAGLEARNSLSTADQVSHARSSMGPVWRPPQEAAVLELAAGLRALGTVTVPAQTVLGTSAPMVRPHSPALVGTMAAVGRVSGAASEVSFGEGLADGVADVHMQGPEPLVETPRPTRWKRRSGGSTNRPSKSPRREQDPGAPWPAMSSGHTPENLRPSVTTISAGDGPHIPPGDGPPPLDWSSAWTKLAAFAAENGADMVGDLSSSPEQDAAIPLAPDDSIAEETVATAAEAWAAVLAFVPAMCGRMQDVLNRLRLCPAALPRVSQGLVLLAQATLGNVLDPFSFAPATPQEWLYPATLLEHGTPLRGYLASSASSSEVVQVLLSQGCPMATIGEDDDGISECNSRAARTGPGFPRWPKVRVGAFVWLLLTPPAGAVQIWQHGVMAGQPVFNTGGVPAAHSVTDLGPVQSPDTPCLSPYTVRTSHPLRTVSVFQPGNSVQPTILQADVRMQGQLFELMTCRALGLQRSEWQVRRLSSSLPSLPTEQYVLSPVTQEWFLVHVPVDLRPLGGTIRIVEACRWAPCGDAAVLALHAARLSFQGGFVCRTTQGWFTSTALLGLLPHGDAFQVWPVNQVPLPMSGAGDRSLSISGSFVDRFGTSLSYPAPDELAYHELSGANAVVLQPHGLLYLGVPSFADDGVLRQTALAAVYPGTLPEEPAYCLRVLPPLDCLPAIQFVVTDTSDGMVPSVVDLRPVHGGVAVVEVVPTATPAERIYAAVRCYGEPVVSRPLYMQLARGHVRLLHRGHVVDAHTPLHAELPAPLVVVPRNPESSSSQPETTLAADTTEAENTLPQFSGIGSHILQPSGGRCVRPCSLALYFFVVGTIWPDNPRLVVVGVLGALLHASGAHAMVHQDLMADRDAPLHTEDVASVAAHRSLARDFGSLESRDTILPRHSPSAAVHLAFNFCIWSPGSFASFQIRGDAFAQDLHDRLWTSRVAAGRGRLELVEPPYADTCVHFVASTREAAQITILADVGIARVCLDVSKDQAGASMLQALQLLYPKLPLQVFAAPRSPLRHGDVIFVHIERDVDTPDIGAISILPEAWHHATASGTELVYITATDLGLLQLVVPQGIATATMNQALLRWLGRQRCLGVGLHAIPVAGVTARVFCLPRRYKSTLTAVLTDAEGFHFPSVVTTIDRDGASPPTSASLREGPGHSGFWDEVLSRSPVCFQRQISTGESHQGPHLCLCVEFDGHRALSTGWCPTRSTQPARYDLVTYVAEHGLDWFEGAPSSALRHVSTQTGASYWPVAASPLFSASVPVPKQADGCSFLDDLSPGGNLFQLACPHMRVRCTLPCVPGYRIWAIRIKNWVYAACTAAVTWHAILQLSGLSSWDLPEIRIHGATQVWEWPNEVASLDGQCGHLLKEGHDTCLPRDSAETSIASPYHEAPASRTETGPATPFLAPESAACRPGFWLSWLLYVPAMVGRRYLVVTAIVLASIAGGQTSSDSGDGLNVTPQADTTAGCNVAWCHELACQSTHFGVDPISLATYFEASAPHDLVRIQLWLPFQGPVAFDVQRTINANDLSCVFYEAGHRPPQHALHVAFDTHSTILDVLSVPAGDNVWWIVRDGTARELLRPVSPWYEDTRRLAVTINSHGQAVSLAASPECAAMRHYPQGARGLVAVPLPRIYGHVTSSGMVLAEASFGVLGAALGKFMGRGVSLLMLAVLARGMQQDQAVARRQSVATWGATPALPEDIYVWTHTLPAPLVVPFESQFNPAILARRVAETGRGVHAEGVFDWTIPQQVHGSAHVLHYPARASQQIVYWLLHYRGRACVYCAVPGNLDWQLLGRDAAEAFGVEGLGRGLFGIENRGRIFTYGSPLTAPPHGTILHLMRVNDNGPQANALTWDEPAPLTCVPQFDYSVCRRPHGESPIIWPPAQQARAPTGQVSSQHELLARLEAAVVCLQSDVEQLLSRQTDPPATYQGNTDAQAEPSASSALPSESASSDLGWLHKISLSCLFLHVLVRPTGGSLHDMSGAAGLLALGMWVTGTIADDEEVRSPTGPTEPSSPDFTDMNMPTPNPEVVTEVAVGSTPHIRMSDSELASTSAPIQGELARPVELFASSQIPQIQCRVAACLYDVAETPAPQPFIPRGCPFTIHNPFAHSRQCQVLSTVVYSPYRFREILQDYVNRRGWQPLVCVQPQPDSDSVHLIPVAADRGLASVVFRSGGSLHPVCVPRTFSRQPYASIQLNGRHTRIREPYQLSRQRGQALVVRDGDCLHADPGPYGPPPPEPVAPARSTAGAGFLAAISMRWYGLALSILLSAAEAVQFLHLDPSPARPPRYCPGHFPWREPWGRRTVASVCAGPSCHTSLLCPWSGPQGVFTCAASLSVLEIWGRYSQPNMYDDFVPVWPSLDDSRLWLVPRAPGNGGLVCVVCRNAHMLRAILLPEKLSLTQLCQSVHYVTGWEVGQVRSPPAAFVRQCLADDAQVILRNGDVLDVLARRADCHPYELHRTSLLQDHVLWTRVCRLHERLAVFIWQPGMPPILTWLESGTEWDPTWLTFGGQFHERFPGMWVPVIWSPAASPQLLKVADSPDLVNVLAEDSAGARCVSVRAVATLHELAQELSAECARLHVLGLDCNSPDALLSLRNGDVVVDGSTYSSQTSIWPALREPRPANDPEARSATPRSVSGWWGFSLLLGSHPWSAHGPRVPGSCPTGDGCRVDGRSRGAFRQAIVTAGQVGVCALLGGAGRVGCLLAAVATSATAMRSRSPRSPVQSDLHEDNFHHLGCWRPDSECPMRDVVRGSSCHYQVLCPFRGWSNPAYCGRDSTRDSLMHVVRCFAGPWSTGFVPVNVEGDTVPVTLLPTCPQLFATVVLHATDLTSAVLMPAYSTYRQMCAFFRRLVMGLQVRITLPPALRHHAHNPDPILRLRDGDAFELTTDARHPQHRYREPFHVASLRSLPHSDIWHLPFRVEEGGWVHVWDPAFPLGEQCSRHWVDAGLCWSPTWLQFLTRGGTPSADRWVPVAAMPGERVTFVVQSADSEANVLLYRPSEPTNIDCRRLLLQNPGPRAEANLVPPDWQLRSDIQERVVYSWPRDGDVMVPRFPSLATHSGTALAGLFCRVPWFFRLFLLWHSLWGGATAMYAPPLEQQQQAVVRVGKFPWRLPWDNRACHETVDTSHDARLLSPFSGLGDIVPVTPDTIAADLVDSMSGGEPPWFQHAVPVWPSLWPRTLVMVPIPECDDLVCVVVATPDWQMAALVPRQGSRDWTLNCLRQCTPGPLWSIRAPIAAQILAAPGSQPVNWRDGDVISAFQYHTDEASYTAPQFISSSHVRHAALWSVDFWVQCDLPIVMWRPGSWPTRTVAPAPQYWIARDETFYGTFSRRYPGQWVPMQWAYSDEVHLCLRSADPERCNVVLEYQQGSKLLGDCYSVRPESTGYSLSYFARSPVGDLSLLGHRGGTVGFPPLRDGDIVHYMTARAKPRSGHPLGVALISILVGYLLAGGSEYFVIGALGALGSYLSVIGVRQKPTFMSISAKAPRGTADPKPRAGSGDAQRCQRNRTLAWVFGNLSCYLAAEGAPGCWKPTAFHWELDLQPTFECQAALHELWWGHRLCHFLPPVCPYSYHVAWEHYPLWGGGVPDALLIATDGSGDQAGSWAFAVWCRWQDRWYRLGWAAAPLLATPWQSQVTSPSYVAQCSFHSELTALQAAATWCAAAVDFWRLHMGSGPTHVTVAVDNAAALQVASGTMVNTFADALAGLAHRWGYVPWALESSTSRLADLLAKEGHLLWTVPRAALVRGRPVLTLPFFAVTTPDEPDQALPPPVGDHVLPATNVRSVQPTSSLAPLAVRVITANVQSMRDAKSSFFNPSGHAARRQYLLQQASNIPCDIVCIQEARSREGRWHTGGWLSWRSGHARGQYGCEIWVRPSLLTPPLTLNSWRIVASMPRILVVTCLDERMPLTVCSAHAPHAERSLQEARDFWHTLKEVLLRRPRHGGLLIGIDANADLFAQDPEESLIGKKIAAGEPERNDLMLLDFCVQLGLFAPALQKAVRRCTQAEVKEHHLWHMHRAFTAWRGGQLSVLDLAAMRDTRRLLAALQGQEARLARRVHALAKRDKHKHFLTLTAAATEEWHNHGRPTEAIQKLRWASRRAAERRAVHAAGGYDIDDQLEEQFRAQEGGRQATPQQTQAAIARWLASPACPCPSALPSKLDLELACHRQKVGKAPGPDEVTNAFWNYFPAYAGEWLWEVCTRIALTGREPAHFKAAIVCALYKKGPAALPQNYRSIALLNGVAKLWQGHLRRTIGSSVLHAYDPLQLGGKRGIPVGFAVATYRAATGLSIQGGRSLAVLFIDIQAAYYEASALERLGVPDEERALLHDCVSCSYWRLVSSDRLFIATRGSRPGDGLADIIFGALFAIALRHIRRECLHLGIGHKASGLEIGCSDDLLALGWADDLALISDYDSPAELLQLFPTVAGIALSTLRALKFRVNLGAGKTEALLDIRGPGAKQVRKQLLAGASCVPLGDGLDIRVAPEYRYLGVVQTPHDTGRRDIELCAQRAYGAWAHGRTILSSTSVPWALRVAWLAGRILPAAYATLATSTATSARAWAPLEGFFEKAVRTLSGSWTFGHFLSKPTLMLLAGISAPSHAADIARVRLVVQLVTRSPPPVFEVFDAAWNRATPWCETLAGSLQRVSIALREDPSGFSASFAFVRHRAAALLSACRRLSRWGTLSVAFAELWRDVVAPRQKQVIGSMQRCVCALCGAALPSHQAWAAHVHCKHSLVNHLTRYTAGTVCLWCHTEHHSTDRLKYHLKVSPACVHGLRVTTGEVYERGTGTKRQRPKLPLRVPARLTHLFLPRAAYTLPFPVP
ncbi:unnamed protein product, partial [Symbiodinium microadriaticum]